MADRPEPLSSLLTRHKSPFPPLPLPSPPRYARCLLATRSFSWGSGGASGDRRLLTGRYIRDGGPKMRKTVVELPFCRQSRSKYEADLAFAA